ncbi:hypothetical protein PNEG_02814 [Pneumocystis murina B123]|uniref:Uncharacterized protein n=1 Tax=Pneumocystis murina (strain B123) TaxID=1069680 RepID=M7NP48_PNEMU|nr:hypothetical protein PNEG_02814 [Pneumocystis murina B123]EMR09042.1 hypothetical protein PNEG_02814 [Pneumocystis murina B123]
MEGPSFNSLFNTCDQKEMTVLKTKEKNVCNKSIESGKIYELQDKLLISKKEQNLPDSMTITKLPKEMKQNSINLTGFVSSIINSVKGAWIKAKKDYKKSLRKQTKLRHLKKYSNSDFLKVKKTALKARKRLKHAEIDKENVSCIYTEPITFQSCVEKSPVCELKSPDIPMSIDINGPNLDNSLTISDSMDKDLKGPELVKTNDLYCSFESLKEEFEKTKKRLQIFEQKYGPFEQLFPNVEHKETLEIFNTPKTQNQTMVDLASSIPSISKDISTSIDNLSNFNQTKNYQLLDEDPSLEILSPVILQNKNVSYNTEIA